MLLALLLAQHLHLATCPQQAAEYDATYRGHIVLAQAFLDPKRSEDEQLRESILQQLKYFWGFVRTSPAYKGRLKVVLSAAAPSIEVVRKERGAYGRELVVDWDFHDKRVEIPDLYTQRAIAAGRVGRDDSALIADYVVRFEMAACGEARSAESELDVPLPDDPWLFYWHVAAKDRVHFRYAGFDARISPCSHEDFAELPEPFYFWYDWWPDRAGVDLDGASYDCKALLSPARDFRATAFHLHRKAEPQPQLASIAAKLPAGPLSATVLIGVLDYHAGDLGFARLREALSAKPAAQVLAELDPPDRGTRFFLQYLAGLGDLIDAPQLTTALRGDYLEATVRGVLKRSRREITLRSYVGLTDVFGLRPPAHWAILREALERDPIIVYAGHSGIGENFRLAQIAQHAMVPPDALTRAPFQLIAFLSCYSYMYFGQDLIASHRPRAYVFTGTEFTSGDAGALAMIDLVDEALAGAKPVLRYIPERDFVMVKEF